MNQTRAFVISFLCAVGAALLVVVYVNGEKDKVRQDYGQEVAVVVAAQNINEMEEIQPGMLTIRQVPKKFVQPGYSSDPKAFEGSIASAPFQNGEQILKTKILLKGVQTGIANQVTINNRAISLPVSDLTGVTKLLNPGDRVDLVTNTRYPKPGGGTESEVKTLMQNVLVLAVGKRVQNQIPEAFEVDAITGIPRAKNLRGDQNFNTITVEVSPVDAQKLIYVMDLGTSIFLTLRNPVDRMVAAMPTVTVDDVLGQNSRKGAAAAEANVRKPTAEEQRPAPKPQPVVEATPAPPPPLLQKSGVSFAN